MITHDNFKEVVSALSPKDKRRIRASTKEYIVLYLHIFNAGSYVDCRLTDDYNRYKNVSDNGNCILPIDEILHEFPAPDQYRYIINLNERGYFNAAIYRINEDTGEDEDKPFLLINEEEAQFLSDEGVKVINGTEVIEYYASMQKFEVSNILTQDQEPTTL